MTTAQLAAIMVMQNFGAGGLMADMEPTPGDLSAPVRLLNLTEHEIVLDAQQHSAGPADPSGLTPPSALRLPSAGQFARVDDTRARLNENWLNTATERIRLTRLRRSSRLTDLPGPERGTTYVVSRLTAQAARRRGDLVFPLTEIRDWDSDGRVIGARGLGTYRRTPAVSEWYRDWRAKASERRSRRSLPTQWLTGLLFATGTALLSGGLGLFPSMLDDATANGWAAAGQAWTDWLTLVFLVAGAAVLGVAARRWLTFMRIRGERGTAYVIEEQAIHWLHEEKTAVLATISDEFASVLRVPGAEALGAHWRWQADAESAPQWDARTDQLVHSFWAVHYNDDHVTHNAVFVWAPWPVAMAFGARATARRRGLVLHVRQRPSYGAAGARRELRLEDGAHDFLRGRDLPPLPAAAPGHALEQAAARVTVTIETLSMPNAPLPPAAARKAGEDTGSAPPAASPASGPVPELLLLLVRLVRQDIGPIPLDLSQAEDISLHLSPSLVSAVPAGKHDMPVAEWRLTADDGSQLPWSAFPRVAETIADWVEQQAAAHLDHVVLLAARVPQEIAVGLGIQLGQRSATWPQRVYPVHYTGECLTVAGLDLGRNSVPGERK